MGVTWNTNTNKRASERALVISPSAERPGATIRSSHQIGRSAEMDASVPPFFKMSTAGAEHALPAFLPRPHDITFQPRAGRGRTRYNNCTLKRRDDGDTKRRGAQAGLLYRIPWVLGVPTPLLALPRPGNASLDATGTWKGGNTHGHIHEWRGGGSAEAPRAR